MSWEACNSASVVSTPSWLGVCPVALMQLPRKKLQCQDIVIIAATKHHLLEYEVENSGP